METWSTWKHDIFHGSLTLLCIWYNMMYLNVVVVMFSRQARFMWAMLSCNSSYYKQHMLSLATLFSPCHEKTWAAAWQNHQSGMCAQRRLRSPWASAVFPVSSLLNEWLRAQAFFMRTAKTDHTGRMPRLIWVFAGRTCHFVGFVVLQLSPVFGGVRPGKTQTDLLSLTS